MLTFGCAALTARAEVNLSPAVTEYLSEGIKYTQLAFNDDKRVVTYVPPLSWSYRGSATQLQLTPARCERASAVIEVVPLPNEQPLDEKTVAILKQRFEAALPPASQGAKVLGEEQSPLLISGTLPTYEVSASYTALGETFLRSTLFANAGKTQLRFTVTARKSDFEALHRVFRASLISWQWSPEKSTNAAPVIAQPVGGP